MAAKLELVRAEYQGTEIQFNEDGWFNATQAAERFGKRPVDWTRLDETQEYLKVLGEELRSEPGSLLKVKRGGRGRSDATWLHPKLGVAFARWLDVRFGVWCDLQIDNLIRKDHPHFDWRRVRHEATSSFKVMNDILQSVRAEIGKATQNHHYSNEARLINWALTGEFKGLDRDALSFEDLDILAKLEEKNTVLIGRGVAYADRKKFLEQYAIDLRPAPLVLSAAR